jgi:hypothetical protein
LLRLSGSTIEIARAAQTSAASNEKEEKKKKKTERSLGHGFEIRAFAGIRNTRASPSREEAETKREGWKGPGQGPTVITPSEFYDRLLQKQERHAPISHKSGVTQFD